MIPTRQKILDYLREHHQATAPEISAALNMTRENIRYHLSELLEAGLIEVVPVSNGKPRGRGRPVRLYRPSSAQRPNNLLQLASLLLDSFQEANAGCADPAPALRRFAAAMVDAEPFPKNLTQRLNKVMQSLNQKRYQARWEARPQGPLLILRNCPYAALLPEHPELCQIDAYFLEAMTGRAVDQAARMDPFTGRPPACLFYLRQLPAGISGSD